VSLTTGADTWMNARAPKTSHGADAKLLVDGSPDNGALIRWDLSAIPAGSNITSASINFHLPQAGDPSESVYNFYALRRDWSEANATWTNADTGIAWGTSGARNTASDRYAEALAHTPAGGTVPAYVTTYLDNHGVAQVERWVNGVDPNYGFAIQEYANGQSNSFRFSSFNSANPPTLVVNYCPASGGSLPALSDTPTPDPVSRRQYYLALTQPRQYLREAAPACRQGER
jgi:hypothetical protein